MVVKGIIKTINFNSNSCTVRLPFFENAGNSTEIVTNAIFSTIPGVYNGYKVGDVVFVEFENNDFDQAVVTGKLYLGAAEEGQEGRGAFNVSNLAVENTATIPITTKLSFPGNNETTVGVKNDLSTYKSIEDIARNLQKQETQIGSINAQLIDTGDSIGARVAKLEEDDARHEATLLIHANEIEAKVSKEYNNGTQQGLGWDLNEKNWQINAYDTVEGQEGLKELNIVTINRNGMTLNGDLKINGYPSEIDIRYAQNNDPEVQPALYSGVGTKSTKANYIGFYIEDTTHQGDEDYYILVTKDNYSTLPITENVTIAYDISNNWSDEAPTWVDGAYIWQWTRTFKYKWDKTTTPGKWTFNYTDKIVNMTGAAGESGQPGPAGVGITSLKTYYQLLDPTAVKPAPPDENKPVPSTSNWKETPAEYIDGYVYWLTTQTIYSDDISSDHHISYSDPIKDNGLDGVYALAQGKSTNYYSETAPINPKDGDSWFDIGYNKITPTSNKEYINTYYKTTISQTGAVDCMVDPNDPNRLISYDTSISPAPMHYYLIKINSEADIANIPSEAEIYTTNILKQYDESTWVDISGELVTNKITANYINTMDITAKNITIIDPTIQPTEEDPEKNILFKASTDENRVKVGGFEVTNEALTNNSSQASTSIMLGSNIDTEEEIHPLEDLITDINIGWGDPDWVSGTNIYYGGQINTSNITFDPAANDSGNYIFTDSINNERTNAQALTNTPMCCKVLAFKTTELVDSLIINYTIRRTIDGETSISTDMNCYRYVPQGNPPSADEEAKNNKLDDKNYDYIYVWRGELPDTTSAALAILFKQWDDEYSTGEFDKRWVPAGGGITKIAASGSIYLSSIAPEEPIYIFIVCRSFTNGEVTIENDDYWGTSKTYKNGKPTFILQFPETGIIFPDVINVSDAFKVKSTGKTVLTNADISGKILLQTDSRIGPLYVGSTADTLSTRDSSIIFSNNKIYLGKSGNGQLSVGQYAVQGAVEDDAFILKAKTTERESSVYTTRSASTLISVKGGLSIAPLNNYVETDNKNVGGLEIPSIVPKFCYWSIGTKVSNEFYIHYQQTMPVPGDYLVIVTGKASLTKDGVFTKEWNWSKDCTVSIGLDPQGSQSYTLEPPEAGWTVNNIAFHSVIYKGKEIVWGGGGYTDEFFFTSILAFTPRTFIYSYGHIYPKRTDFSDLGSTDNRWNNIYANNTRTTNIWVNGTQQHTSDKNLKKDFDIDFTKYNKLFDSLTPTSYRLKDNDTKIHFGFIAQDVESAIEGAGLDSNQYNLLNKPDEQNKYYSLSYVDLHALEVYEIQKLKKQIKELEDKVKELENK